MSYRTYEITYLFYFENENNQSFKCPSSTNVLNISYCRSLCWKNAICCCKVHISFIPSFSSRVIYFTEFRLLKCIAYKWSKRWETSGRSGGVHRMAKSARCLPYFRQLWRNITWLKGTVLLLPLSYGANWYSGFVAWSDSQRIYFLSYWFV